MTLSELDITPQKAKQFEKKGIFTAENLLRFLPRKYLDFTRETGILSEDEVSCLVVQIERFSTYFRKVDMMKAFGKIMPKGEKIAITWFNQNFLLHRYQGCEGQMVYVAGKVRYNSTYQTYEMSMPEMFEPNIEAGKRVVPVYPKIAGMSNDYLVGKIKMAAGIPDASTEPLPEDSLQSLGLLTTKEMLYQLHFPESMAQVEKAKERLIYDDLILFAMEQEWAVRNSAIGSPFSVRTKSLMQSILKALPYSLTQDQKSAIRAMMESVESGKRINALVQGDVGCGKTIVAFLMMAAFVGSGYQAVLMAPTQVLARQHYNDLVALMEPLGLAVTYLGSELKAAEKKRVIQQIESGEVKFIVGTNSVISSQVHYKNLALTVTDEEHKFGVAQRNALVDKASMGVHSITMSATPIPRSLAQVVYGNTVQLHTIRSMPAGRKPVTTGVAISRERIYKFLRSQIRHGHQAYIVCPMIDSNEDMEGVRSVEDVSREYKEALAADGIRIATLTGRDAKSVTEETIASFKAGDIDILISTTVIEVGVNVPNATVMVITNAERFGLSSLHQLRGRVGRSSLQSYCVLESDTQTEVGKMRLDAMCSTTDGFKIAEADLKIRGAGDFIGTRQSGENRYMALMIAYPERYKIAQMVAKDLLDRADPCVLARQVMNGQISSAADS